MSGKDAAPAADNNAKETDMKRRMMAITLVACLLTGVTVYAGRGLSMKCQAKPEKDAKTGKTSKPCGYESRITFGGGMFYNQTTGYCRACKKFVYLRWTREGIPAEMKARMKLKATPRPAPLGQVWDAQTGKILTIHACPTCKGPFLEIKNPDELKHCPACNKPHFAIDKSKPESAID
jgi:ssDNA-binding Zn-finger/Zn-ribbon topoisomerase 1